MKVIITGGSGLIGRSLTESLVNDQHEVIILSRNPNWIIGLPAGVLSIPWDGKTSNGWADLVDGADAIINLAGESIAGEIPFGVRWTKKRKKDILNSRIDSGNAVVEAIEKAKNKPEVLIQASAIGYYGPSAGIDITEFSSGGSDFQAKVCKQWEDSTSKVESMGVRRVVLRTALVLSDKGGILPWFALPFKLFVGGPLGSGKQYVSWIHIDDEIAAIKYLLEEKSAQGVYNLAAPEPLPNKTFGKKIGEILGRPAFIPAPGFVFKIAWGEASTLVLDGLKVLPEKLTTSGYKFLYPDASSALNNLLKD